MKDATRFKITPSEKYPRNIISIKTWLAEKNEFSNRINSLVQIKKETEKAFLIEFVTGASEEHWLPKSQCEIVKDMNGRLGEF